MDARGCIVPGQLKYLAISFKFVLTPVHKSTTPNSDEPHTKTHYAMLENIFHIIFGEKQEYFYDPTWFNFEYVPIAWDPTTADYLKFKIGSLH